jgi:ribose 5-phosphate isomerase B
LDLRHKKLQFQNKLGEKFMTKKIAIGADHAGFEEKEKVKKVLDQLGVEYEDVGTFSNESVDYPDFAEKVGEKIENGESEQGILVCGSGIGVAMAANKMHGIRAAQAWNEETARLSRQHNNANVLTIGARVIPETEIPKIVKAWLETDFEGGRHAGRVEKMMDLEGK